MAFARAFAGFLAISGIVSAGASIFPGDHWNYVSALEKENADQLVKEAVDAGKTMFIRWIASEG